MIMMHHFVNSNSPHTSASHSRMYFFMLQKLIWIINTVTRHASDEQYSSGKMMKFCVLTAGVHLREETKEGETEDVS